MTSRLVAENGLLFQTNNVWSVKESEGPDTFLYTDGDQQETYIYNVLSAAQDLSSFSDELENRIVDWSSEAHLSSKRSNILRGIDFSDVNNVLEIGSGCGAVSRYLGEQGVQLDAVEGSARRAEITRMRCRDMENVHVSNVPFEVLSLPDNHYDMALLIGVLEYAGKYAEEGISPEEAAEAMLRQLIKTLKPDGVLIVAIENRIGFKYLAGATEDHFGVPYIGLGKYPQYDCPITHGKKGIETWDKKQWQEIVEKLSVAHEFNYPFPDYKLPQSILSDAFISSAKFPWCSLNRSFSRDYTASWRPTIDEHLFWETVSRGGALDTVANSFLIVLGENPEVVRKKIGFDFVHFPGHHRKQQYRMIARKEKNDKLVVKLPLFDALQYENNQFLQQITEPEPFQDELLLVNHWIHVLRYWDGLNSFTSQVLDKYYKYVQQICGQEESSNYYDLLPFNITVKSDGTYHYFDQEWKISEVITPAFIFFRALTYFAWSHKKVLQDICESSDLKTVGDFVRYVLEVLVYSADRDVTRFVELEDRLQKEICLKEHFISIQQLLDSPIYSVASQIKAIKTYLMYTGEKLVPCEPDSVETQGDESLSLVFSLPPDALEILRFDPCEGRAHINEVFRFKRIDLSLIPEDSSSVSQVNYSISINGSGFQTKGLTFISDYLNGIYIVESDDPHIFLPVENRDVDNSIASIRCVIEIEWLAINGMEFKLDQARKLLDQAKLALQEKDRQLNKILQSRVWRVVERVKKILPDRGLHTLAVESQSKVAKERIPEHYKISILLPVFNSGRNEIEQLIESVEAQPYKNWEICLVDDASTDADTKAALREIKHLQVKVHFLSQSENLTGALNRALSLADGDYMMFLSQFDRLAPNALSEIADEIEKTDADIVYYDEVLLDQYLYELETIDKPDFSETILMNYNLFGNAYCVKKKLLKKIGVFNSELDGAEHYDFVLRLTEKTNRISHIAKGIYHRRYLGEKGKGEILRENTAGKNSLTAALLRRGIAARVEDGDHPGSYHIVGN